MTEYACNVINKGKDSKEWTITRYIYKKKEKEKKKGAARIVTNTERKKERRSLLPFICRQTTSLVFQHASNINVNRKFKLVSPSANTIVRI